MNLSLGIVGLPNVGKSTLFNALTKQQVLAANYPFATIDPNHGIVPVKDERLTKLAEIEKSEKTVYATVEFVDIAGLVKGAAEGQGLGNKFLANIRETSAIVHLVRAFRNDNITHVENSVDPARDIELINLELILKDIETMESKAKAVAAQARTNAKLKPLEDFANDLFEHLKSEKLAVDLPTPNSDDVKKFRRELFLLTDKPVIYLVNTTDEDKEASVEAVKKIVGNKDVIGMDIKTEADLGEMNEEDRQLFMDELGMSETGLEMLTKEAYKLLGLISYFTAGPKEARAWTIVNGANAQEAAGEIHTDISKNFIAADVVKAEDFIAFGGWVKSKENGKVRLEGKSYIVQDGDVMLFKHNG